MMDAEVDYRPQLSSFQHRLLQRAQATLWPVTVKAYLTDVRVHGRVLVGLTWGNLGASLQTGRFTDGRLMNTSDVLGAVKIGRHWLIETLNSYYVVVTFGRNCGRAEFQSRRRSFVRSSRTNPLTLH